MTQRTACERPLPPAGAGSAPLPSPTSHALAFEGRKPSPVGDSNPRPLPYHARRARRRRLLESRMATGDRRRWAPRCRDPGYRPIRDDPPAIRAPAPVRRWPPPPARATVGSTVTAEKVVYYTGWLLFGGVFAALGASLGLAAVLGAVVTLLVVGAIELGPPARRIPTRDLREAAAPARAVRQG